MSVLENIRGHNDLICLNESQREQLCAEIRDLLISSVSKTGGHLASNLGVVELTVAIETVFDTERDRLVFDVGHQSYIHKLLTGRQADFHTLRQYGGISGFPKPSESASDAFVAGHASSSVSIGLGMARARTLQGGNYNVVVMLGDGAATGGMVYEGLNDAAESGEPLLVILNDNAMSIDNNVGGMASHLSKLRSKAGYLGMKKKYKQFLLRVPGGRFVYRVIRGVKHRIRRMLIPTTIFESMGFTYLGPVDGHDTEHLISLVRIARDMGKPVLLHVLTQKGKGFAPAEERPGLFHGVGRFDPVTGQIPGKDQETFSDAFGAAMCELAQDDPRLCAITAAMPGGTGLLQFKKEFPKRMFDVGIAEEHAMSMAGGLAKQGMIPVVALYSTFLQRSFDMILQDISMLGLHTVIAVDRAGLVGEDGQTHHGVFDIGFLRQAPNMKILCPASTAELKDMLRWAVRECHAPVAIRYPRGGNGGYTGAMWDAEAPVICHRTGADCTIITYGTLVNHALEASDLLKARGIQAGVYRLTAIHPLPAGALEAALSDCAHAVILEEVCSGSGISEALQWALADRVPACRFTKIDLGDQFVTHGAVKELYGACGLDGASIASHIMEVLKVEN